jgi:Zn-dependent peptidase ImmA (M78 family)
VNRKTEQAAERTLARCGILGPAVPVDDIAKRMGATVLEESLGQGVSGILYRHEGGSGSPVIAVNSKHAAVRRRFSIAHEIGHLELHTGRPIIVDHLVRGRVNMRDERSSLATSREEIDANGFAAALLMPADWIAADLENSLGGAVSKTVDTLAQRYDVSTQAMEWRLVNLGYRSAP